MKFKNKIRGEVKMPTYQVNIRDEITELRTDIRELRREMNRFKGFVSGVVWAAATVAAVMQVMVGALHDGGVF